MNKRKMTVFAVLSAVLLTSAIFIIFYSSTIAGENTKPIVLPPAATEGKTGDIAGIYNPVISERPSVVVAVTPDNVKVLVKELQRPESYGADYLIYLFWEGGQTSLKRSVWVLKDMVRVSKFNAAGDIEENVVTYNEKTYIWAASANTYYTGKEGSISADDNAQIPTYENILDVPEEQIVYAGYEDYNSEACIRVTVSLPDSETEIHYWVSLDSGLLIRSEKYNDGSLTYSASLSDLSYAIPDAAIFRLPDGRTPA